MTCATAAVLAVLVPQAAHAAKIREIRVEGVERIEPETVLSYLPVKAGDEVFASDLDGALKALFATGLFLDVHLEMVGEDALVVRVAENPVINRVAFEGNDKLSSDDLRTEVQLRPRTVFTRTKVQADVERILEIYRRSGRYSATVEPKIIKLDQNRVDLVFEINEGPKTKIQRIDFIGNKVFSDETLQKELRSKETRWYRFLTQDDKYDADRLSFDQELLRRFYLKHGYADFRVDSSVAELTPDRQDFFVTFTIEEGQRYKVGKVEVKSAIPDLDVAALSGQVLLTEGEWYDSSKVEDTVTNLTGAVGDLQFAFIDIDPQVQRNRDSLTVDVTFQINESSRVFVEKINIHGNVRTLDEVIRREMELVEGDAYNASKLEKSEQKIRDLGYFEEITVEKARGSSEEQSVIDIEVQEQSTGELSVGAGFSTSDGALADFRLSERNFLGKGQQLGLAFTLSSRRQEFDINFTEPYFLKRDLAAGFDLFRITRDLQDESSYDQRRTGGALRLGYPLSREWRQSLRYRWERNEIENVQAGASLFIQQQAGLRVTSSVSQGLAYDTRDSKLDPREGLFGWLDTEVAGLGGDARYFSTRLGATKYFTVRPEWVLSILGEGGYIFGIGEDVAINERFFIGGSTLRGFEAAGIGPRDSATEDALGGNRFLRGTVELGFPSGLGEELGIRLHTFSDFGTLGEVDDTGAGILDEESIRLSLGAGVSWRSPLGPIRLDMATPIMEEDYDVNELVRVNFGTRF